MNNYFDPLNGKVFINSAAILTRKAEGLLSVEEQAAKFAKWLREARDTAGLNKAQLAKEAKIARSYVTNLEGAIKNALTNKPTLPKPEIVERLAVALGVPVSEAREAAGYAAAVEDRPTGEPVVDLELRKLNRYFKELPRECQLDVMALTEALWRRRRAEGRAERAERNSSGKHSPEVVRPGVERKNRGKKAS